MQLSIELDRSRLLDKGILGTRMVGAPKPSERIVLDRSKLLGNDTNGVNMVGAPKPDLIKPT